MDISITEQPHLLVTQDDSILIATFKWPDRLNAMSMELMASQGESDQALMTAHLASIGSSKG